MPGLVPGNDGAQRLAPFVEDEERAGGDEGKSERVIPAQRLLQVQHREAGEHDQRDHLLHGLELRSRVDRNAPAIVAGTASQYSKNAMPQLTMMTMGSG